MFNQIKLHFKQAKRLTHYFIAVSGISLMLPIAIFVFFKDSAVNAAQWVFGFMLAVMCIVCFIEANTQGNKDRRSSVSIYKKYRLKGFVLGFCAQFYIWTITIVLVLLRDAIMGGPITLEFRNYIVNFFVLQYFDVMQLLGYNFIGYIVAILILPVVCMIGYELAYFNIDIDDKLGGIRKR